MSKEEAVYIISVAAELAGIHPPCHDPPSLGALGAKFIVGHIDAVKEGRVHSIVEP